MEIFRKQIFIHDWYMPKCLTSNIFDFVLDDDNNIKELDKLRMVCKGWNELTIEHYHHFSISTLRQKFCQPTLSAERRQKINNILSIRFQPLEKTLNSLELYSRLPEIVTLQRNKLNTIKDTLSEFDSKTQEMENTINSKLKSLIVEKIREQKELGEQKELSEEDENLLNQIMTTVEQLLNGQKGSEKVALNSFNTNEMKKKFLIVLERVLNEFEKVVELRKQLNALNQEKSNFMTFSLKEMNRLTQEEEIIKQKLEKCQLEVNSIDLNNTSQATPLDLNKDRTEELIHLINAGNLSVVARVLLFKPVFDSEKISDLLTNSLIFSEGGNFCFGLMAKLGYDLPSNLISLHKVASSLTLCKNLKFSDFIKSGVILYGSQEKVLQEILWHLPNPSSSQEKIQSISFHPELEPFLRKEPLTREELKEILVDLFCTLKSDSIRKGKESYRYSEEKKQLIQEVLVEYRKEIKNARKPSFIKKIFSKLSLTKNLKKNVG